MALLRKAIPVIPLMSGRFWIFVRGLQFFPGFRMVVGSSRFLIACGVHPVSVGGKKRFLQLSKIFVALSSLDWVTRGTPTTTQD